jgi:hypothetical protein
MCRLWVPARADTDGSDELTLAASVAIRIAVGKSEPEPERLAVAQRDLGHTGQFGERQ